jgi:uncharacterized coiled-coil protein SlyX
MKKIVGKNSTTALGIICILLAVSLVGAIANYTSIISAKDNTITSKDSTISSLNSEITSKNSQIANLQSQVSSLNSQMAALQSQVASANSQISSLNSSVTTLQSQLNDFTAIINMSKSRLETLVFHVCEKTGSIHIPDVDAVYQQILALNTMYNVLVLPEHNGHANWTEELVWLTANFGGQQGIPIMLDIFGGGDGPTPTPMLSTNDILAAMAVSNVKWLKFAEVMSWHIEHDQPFPNAYVASILEFCRTNRLKLFWTEWKTETFKAIQTYITGYEDIVTVSFSTNSQDLEPAAGFLLLNKMFQHLGGSIQAWYWTTRYDSDLLNMPISSLIQHALSAKNMGAEILQFEPYWYFFDNGQAKENLKLLETMLT